MFDTSICTLLQSHTTSTPSIPDEWYRPWAKILEMLFPSSRGYFLAPKRRTSQKAVIVEVQMFSKHSTLPFLTVLVIEVRNTPDWPASIPVQETQIRRRTDAALAGSDGSKARSKVYWISVIGPHWRYGVKDEDEKDPRPLIDWRHTTHDQESYEHLQDLARLVESL